MPFGVPRIDETRACLTAWTDRIVSVTSDADAPGVLAGVLREAGVARGRIGVEKRVARAAGLSVHVYEGLQAALRARQKVPGLPVLVLSQYVEQLYARELLADGQGGVGYLLKDRVSNADQFLDALRRVAAGGTAMDPQVIAKLLVRNATPLTRLTDREREVLELMAEGRSNTAIAQRLHVSEGAVAKHTTSIFAKLDLPPSDDDNRRVLAVLAYLNG